MKILFVTNLFPPEMRGGAERLVEALAFAAMRAGHEAHVLSTTGRRVHGVEMSLFNGITVHRFCPRLPYHLLDDTHQPLWRRIAWHVQDLFLPMAHDVCRAVDAMNPDMIFSHNLRGMGLSLTRALQRAQAPWAHTLHDVQLLVPSGLQWAVRAPGMARLWQSSAITRPYVWCMRRVFRTPDVVISPTTFLADAHHAAGLFLSSRTVVLQNPLARIPTAQRTQTHDPFKLLFVGQLELHKGLEVMIEALSYLKIPVVVTVIGEGSRKDDAMERALTLSDRVAVSFLGAISHNEVLRMMAQHDALVFPSLVVENCPGVLLEARSVGLPVIASDVGGVRELVDGDALVPPGEPRALAQTIWQFAKRGVRLSPQKALDADAYFARLIALMALS